MLKKIFKRGAQPEDRSYSDGLGLPPQPLKQFSAAALEALSLSSVQLEPRTSGGLSLLPKSREHDHERRARLDNRAFASLAASQDPLWLSQAFVGEFCDAFCEDTSLEGGDPLLEISTFTDVTESALRGSLREALTLFSPAQVQTVRSLLAKLRDAASVVGRPTAGATAFEAFLGARSKEVSSLAVGDFLLWPGGWLSPGGGHAIMLLLHKVKKDEIGLVVCNTGDGVQYHRATAEGYPKAKRRTAMRVMVSVARLADLAVLYVLWRQLAKP